MTQTTLDFTGPDLPQAERSVYELLKRGRENAIQEKDLAFQTGMSGRAIQKVVRNIIMVHGLLVASSPSPPAGFYIPTTREELLETTGALRHRGIAILARAAKLSKLSLEEIFHQARLEFEGKFQDGRGY